MTDPISFLNGRVLLYPGDCREILKTIPDNSIDSCCCDPPYNLGFMGRVWDKTGIANDTELWTEVLRVLKPGGYILAFSSSRTYHRMACAIEDAGFITHPMIGWLFGMGFPKAHSVSKHIDRMAGAKRERICSKDEAGITHGSKVSASEGWVKPHHYNPDADAHYLTAPATDASKQWDGWYYGGQSLKPSLEPIYCGQKPFERGLNGTQNVLKHGVGAINIDACRIPIEENDFSATNRTGDYGETSPGEIFNKTQMRTPINRAGRWPANLCHDGSEEVLAAFPLTAAPGGYPADKAGFGYNGGERKQRGESFTFDEGGSAARFFYSAKADAHDRIGSRHPTVKPLSLMQWLVRLVTPPGGLCLDPFAGTGTTAEACFREGMRCILIEREAESIADIERRMKLCLAGPGERARESIKARGLTADPGPLFQLAKE